ncbi:hypothetical protein GQ53DRAFT_287593 [Thozetella sp. PMI_491]|nr:hypothetical protein GQ53DRAFT_287593 [Thozetella sp. PMI_491]
MSESSPPSAPDWPLCARRSMPLFSCLLFSLWATLGRNTSEWGKTSMTNRESTQAGSLARKHYCHGQGRPSCSLMDASPRIERSERR